MKIILTNNKNPNIPDTPFLMDIEWEQSENVSNKEIMANLCHLLIMLQNHTVLYQGVLEEIDRQFGRKFTDEVLSAILLYSTMLHMKNNELTRQELETPLINPLQLSINK